ncbi:unnamed protein product [Prorocentrum cordatum]|uniref:Ubiquitin-like domain-containing protein n=1 Tax=Prorocentrum cordatum TaxID=2364126 RepID=A0ABN9RG83_9DINO|nr:unnamed protein product [Polarella glacialis]
MDDPFKNVPVRVSREDGAVGEDGRKEEFDMLVEREVDVGKIKSRIEMEFDVVPAEQLVLFRGRPVDDENDANQPLCSPDLEDIIEAAVEGHSKALQMAILRRPFLVPPFLRKHGFEHVNACRKTGATVLHHAVRRCSIRVVKELLGDQQFLNVDGCDRSGQTALHAACACRFREVCLAILDAKNENGYNKFVAVSKADSEKKTALHFAALWGDAPVCRAIMGHPEFGPQHAGLVDICGCTALDYAVEGGHAEVAEEISAFSPEEAADREKRVAAREARLEAEREATRLARAEREAEEREEAALAERAAAERAELAACEAAAAEAAGPHGATGAPGAGRAEPAPAEAAGLAAAGALAAREAAAADAAGPEGAPEAEVAGPEGAGPEGAGPEAAGAAAARGGAEPPAGSEGPAADG